MAVSLPLSLSLSLSLSPCLVYVHMTDRHTKLYPVVTCASIVVSHYHVINAFVLWQLVAVGTKERFRVLGKDNAQ